MMRVLIALACLASFASATPVQPSAGEFIRRVAEHMRSAAAQETVERIPRSVLVDMYWDLVPVRALLRSTKLRPHFLNELKKSTSAPDLDWWVNHFDAIEAVWVALTPDSQRSIIKEFGAAIQPEAGCHEVW